MIEKFVYECYNLSKQINKLEVDVEIFINEKMESSILYNNSFKYVGWFMAFLCTYYVPMV